MQLKMYENEASSMEYTTDSIVTGHYLKITNDKYCLYECNNNKSFTEGHFAIKYCNNYLREAEPYHYNTKSTHDMV